MGNQHGKEQVGGKYGKKGPRWKNSNSGLCPPLPPGKPELVTGNPNYASDSVTIRWTKPAQDGGSPVHGYVVEHRRIGSQQWIRAVNMLIPTTELTINGLEPGWQYQFRIIAKNSAGVSEPSDHSEALSVMLQRTAASAPVINQDLPESVAVVEGGKLELGINVSGEPYPEIVWYKDGFELLPDDRRVRIEPDGNWSHLTIIKVTPLDEGEIKCTAGNRSGVVTSKTMVTVENPPKIILPKNYEEGLLIDADETMRLKVGIEGRPTPTVTWSHNGLPIVNGDRYEVFTTDKTSSLTVQNACRGDRGEYQLHALNKIGEDVASFLITVISRPAPPGKVMITRVLNNTVTVSFAAPPDDGGCKIGNYIIEYNRVGWDVWLKATTTRTLTATLNELILGSEYKFRAKCENPYGISDPGEESHMVFIPDPSRGIFRPVSRPSSRTGSSDTLSKSAFLVPGYVRPTVRRSLTPDRPISKVDAGTVTPTMTLPRVKHTIRIQLPDEDYMESPSKATISNTLRPNQLFPLRQPNPQTNPAQSNLQDNSQVTQTTVEKEPSPVLDEIPTFVQDLIRSNSPLATTKPLTEKIENLTDLNNNEKLETIEVPKEKENKLHNSSEFMLVLYANDKEVKNENCDTFDFDAEDSAPPPPMSLSVPDLRAEIPLQPPLRPAVSSTELIYERAMARVYQAVANEEAEAEAKEKDRNNELGERDAERFKEFSADEFDRRKSLPESQTIDRGQIYRMRLNSLQEEKRLTLKRRLSTERAGDILAAMQRKRSEDEPEERPFPLEPQSSTETAPVQQQSQSLPASRPESRQGILKTPSKDDDLYPRPVERQKSVTIVEPIVIGDLLQKPEDYHSDYTDSTASSEDSIVEKMKQLKERLAHIESDEEDPEKTTYHPRSMELINTSPRTMSPQSLSPRTMSPTQSMFMPPKAPVRMHSPVMRDHSPVPPMRDRSPIPPMRDRSPMRAQSPTTIVTTVITTTATPTPVVPVELPSQVVPVIEKPVAFVKPPSSTVTTALQLPTTSVEETNEPPVAPPRVTMSPTRISMSPTRVSTPPETVTVLQSTSDRPPLVLNELKIETLTIKTDEPEPEPELESMFQTAPRKSPTPSPPISPSHIYIQPDHGEAASVLNRPKGLPDPNFVPKPILKRPMSPASSPPPFLPSSPKSASPLLLHRNNSSTPQPLTFPAVGPPVTHSLQSSLGQPVKLQAPSKPPRPSSPLPTSPSPVPTAQQQRPLSPIMRPSSPKLSETRNKKKKSGIKKFFEGMMPHSKNKSSEKLDTATSSSASSLGSIPTITVSGANETSTKQDNKKSDDEKFFKRKFPTLPKLVPRSPTISPERKVVEPIVAPRPLVPRSPTISPERKVIKESDITRVGVASTLPKNMKMLQNRQNSEEENKAVIEFYTEYVKERALTERRKPKTPIYMNPEAIKTVQAKAKQEGEPLSDEEEPTEAVQEESIRATVREENQKRRSSSRDTSLTRILGRSARDPGARPSFDFANKRQNSHDEVLQSRGRSETTTRAGVTPRSASLARPPTVVPGSRDSSLSRPQLKDQFSARIVITGRESSGGAVSKSTRSREASVTRLSQQNKTLEAPETNDHSRSASPTPFMQRKLVKMNGEGQMYRDQDGEMFTRSRTTSVSARSKTPDDLIIEEKVKSNISYAIDVGLLCFTLYVYLFKDALFCIPLLLLLVYRQLGEFVDKQFSPFINKRRKDS